MIADSDDEDDEKPKSKKRKGGASNDTGDELVPVTIQMQQAVTLSFSLKYLTNFAKAAPLCPKVALHMSSEVPLLCEFAFDNGHVRYYLAPKLDDNDE